MSEHVDVVIVGAGLSGIDQAYRLGERCPDRRYVILEARDAIGGTWDLFRYPGVRSDSDMHTLGFPFAPWTGSKAIADGGAIRDYVEDVARRHGIDRHIRFGTRLTHAAWSGAEARWTLAAGRPDGAVMTLTCDFLCMCAGYYDYARGHAPGFTGAERFAGRIVHPQSWPADLDVSGRDVVVIGSGATAVTLVPALADRGARVTMLQRSPTYVVSRPAEDRMANGLLRALPAGIAHRLIRWKNVATGMFFYRLARRRPQAVRRRILAMVQAELGPHYDVATHFTPRYDPWDQRVCLVPDADLFRAIREGRAEVVTDRVDHFTETGIRLASGRELAADVIVTATGLEIKLMGGATLSVDGRPIDLGHALQYKGMMFAGVPNFAFAFGYTNASWTLKADLVARYVCRLLNTMRRRGVRQAMPVNDDPAMATQGFADLQAGYIRRAAGRLPRQGARRPWRLHQNYALDVLTLTFGSVDDAMSFSNPAVPGRDHRAA